MPLQTPWSLVIATFERPDDLRRMLASVSTQTHLPTQVIIVDSSRDDLSAAVAAEFQPTLPLLYERALEPSAARQRNQGALHVTAPLVAFIDDDAALPPELAAKICAVFDADPAGETGGVAARIDEPARPVPRGLLWWYYRLQAGYSHPTYGGQLFGPAINCYPSYTPEESAVAPGLGSTTTPANSPASVPRSSTGDAPASELIPSNWLSSTCVFYRTPLFRREEFPKFAGYSFMEDVHLSARIAKTHRTFFHAGARFEHHDAPSTFKRDWRGLATSRIRNQRIVARDLLGLSPFTFAWKLLFHRLFVTAYLLRRRGPGWHQELLGTWCS